MRQSVAGVHQQQQQQQQPSGGMPLRRSGGSSSSSCSRRACHRSRQPLRVSATLVGPDPRLAASSSVAAAAAAATAAPTSSSSSTSSSGSSSGSSVIDLSRPPKGLRGREVEEAAMWRCIKLQQAHPGGLDVQLPRSWADGGLLQMAYERSAEVTSEYAKTFYLGTQLMTPQQARAIWAIYVWCRRTDELVDGPNASRITPKALDRWEERLEAAFEGRPYDELDATLTDTLSAFPVDIQPFRDMIDGMRMDLVKSRYDTYDELYEYCYRVAGTVALMSMPVMGVDANYKGPLEPVYRAALALGTANQLTNILRDVGEDVETRNRIYVPLDELAQFGIKETELLGGARTLVSKDGVVDDRWKAFMAFQIARARRCFEDAEAGVDLLDANARWPVWSALILYRQILDAIEANGYDNFTRRAYVPKWRKLASLPLAFAKARLPQLNPGYRAAMAAGALSGSSSSGGSSSSSSGGSSGGLQ